MASCDSCENLKSEVERVTAAAKKDKKKNGMLVKRKIEAMTSAQEALEKKNRELADELEVVLRDAEAESARLKDTIIALEKRLNSSSDGKSNEDKSCEPTGLEDELSRLQAQLQESSDKNMAFVLRVSELEVESEQMQSRNSALSSEIKDLKSGLLDSVKSAKSLESDNSRLLQEISGLSTRIEDLEADRKKMKGFLVQANKKLQEYRSKESYSGDILERIHITGVWWLCFAQGWVRASEFFEDITALDSRDPIVINDVNVPASVGRKVEIETEKRLKTVFNEKWETLKKKYAGVVEMLNSELETCKDNLVSSQNAVERSQGEVDGMKLTIEQLNSRVSELESQLSELNYRNNYVEVETPTPDNAPDQTEVVEELQRKWVESETQRNELKAKLGLELDHALLTIDDLEERLVSEVSEAKQSSLETIAKLKQDISTQRETAKSLLKHRDAEIASLKEKRDAEEMRISAVRELQKTKDVLDIEHKKRVACELELERIAAAKLHSDIDLDYLKHVIVKFIENPKKTAELAPVLGRLVHLSDVEISRVLEHRKANEQWSMF